MARGEILDGGRFYWLSGKNGPWVDKQRGTGKVLTRLLFASRNMSLDTIGEISGWQNPKKCMRSLAAEIDAWTGYEIEIAQRRGTVYYGLRESAAA